MNLAICGIFFDGYYDLWEDFLDLFFQNWNDCPYKLYIVNNERELEFSKKYDVNVLHAGKTAEYSRKVQYALDNIDADYYLLLLDDFFVGKKINNEKIEACFSSIISKNLKYYAMPLDEFKKSFKGKKVTKNGSIREISPKAEYTVSCQPAIWEKNFLRRCIGKSNYNAWIFEGVYSKASFAHTKEFLENCYVDKRNPLELKHGALQGKMIPDTIKYFDNVGYTMNNKREVLSSSIYRKHKLKSKIKNLIPLPLQRFIKRHFRTKSVIEKYNEEICKIIKELENV